MQHTATHCNTLQCTKTHSKQVTEAEANKVQQELYAAKARKQVANTATHFNTLHHTATHYNTHFNKLQRMQKLHLTDPTNQSHHIVRYTTVVSR